MVRGFSELGDRLLVIFDGHCVLCNGAVRWFLRRDRRDRLRFAASESVDLTALLARHEIAAAHANAGPETILVVQKFNGHEEEIMVRSDAALAMLGELPRPWPLVAAVLGFVPRTVRDLGYRIIALSRYRIWGRQLNCPIPTAEERGRFL